MRRASALVFHGGAWVFPGGRIEAADVVEHAGQPDALETAKRAGVRETREEAGLTLDPGQLVTVSHWTTPRGRARRFATWFFAVAHSAPVEVVVDGGEISAHRWLRAEAALAAHGRGELELPPPTFVTLWLLRAFDSCAAALEHFRTSEPQVFLPRPRVVEGGVLSLYQGDAAYEGGPVDRAGPRHRLHMLESGWLYECER
ncbi:MAG: hypothetical protein JWN48_5249 [Myxococcaceae bacterium]|nr:hypothetical protein [Myxococcaceae bacterium]